MIRSSSSPSFDGSGSSGFSDSTPPTSSTFDPPPTTQPPLRPLRVVAKAWATATAGTPVEREGVPAGMLPVGTRFGQDDKRSFVRLQGELTTLTLAEDTASGRTTTTPAVSACQITQAAWAEGEATTFASAPPFDATQCVPGQRSSDGRWTFDFTSFASRTDLRGFALVPPAASKPIDFQVNFKAA